MRTAIVLATRLSSYLGLGLFIWTFGWILIGIGAHYFFDYDPSFNSDQNTVLGNFPKYILKSVSVTSVAWLIGFLGLILCNFIRCKDCGEKACIRPDKDEPGNFHDPCALHCLHCGKLILSQVS
jgi:hypothetical protein